MNQDYLDAKRILASPLEEAGPEIEEDDLSLLESHRFELVKDAKETTPEQSQAASH